MVRIPAGSFMMGSNEGPDWSRCHEDNGWSNCEQPVHEVTIGYDFYMGKFELTQAQWLAVMESWPYWDPADYGYGHGPNYPAYCISWNNCQNFVKELNKLGLGTFRLPSEAEWEYACRAGTTTRFYFGDSIECGTSCEDCAAGVLPGNRSDYMWYCGNNSPKGTKPVGGKLPNDFGLYDMNGNVYEWCQDYWHQGYAGAPDDGCVWESSMGSYRVLRGGTWGSDARECRAANRNVSPPDSQSTRHGARFVWTP